MNRKTFVLATVALFVGAGAAAPALASAEASDTPRRICLMLTEDPENQGPEPICIRY